MKKLLLMSILLVVFSHKVTAQVTFLQSTDTLLLVASVNNATTYKWYDNGDSVDNDSVYKINADSAYYSKSHTIYCLASNSFGSLRYGDWTIKNRQIAFRRKY